MILVDANLLLYAHEADGGSRYEAARAWLERLLETEPDVRLGLVTLFAFIRIATDPRVYAQPRTPAEAIGIVEAMLDRPNVALASPGDRHWAILADVAISGRARGPMLMDAHLAALAIEHGATLATADRDFTRFRGLRHLDPLAGA
jgi:toxin-antitoxin system PIN domain toxin